MNAPAQVLHLSRVYEARPRPAAADIADAAQFVAEAYDNDPQVCRTWLAHHRASLLADVERCFMQKRLEREWRARFMMERN